MNDFLYNDLEIKELILQNIIKMLINRGIFIADKTQALKNISSEDETYIMSDKGIHRIKLVIGSRKVTTINNTKDIELFMNNNLNDHKIIVLNELSYSAKLHKQLAEFNTKITDNTKYNGIEVFMNTELISCLVDSHYVSKHRILTRDEIDQLKTEYDISLKELPTISLTDKIARYYGAKIADVIEIERPSLASGISIYYRYVTSDNVFEKLKS